MLFYIFKSTKIYYDFFLAKIKIKIVFQIEHNIHKIICAAWWKYDL